MESGCVRAVGAIVGCVMIGLSCGVVGCANCCSWSGRGFPIRVKMLRCRAPQCRQSLALKSIRPSGRCSSKQSSQRIHLVDSVTGKQAGGTSLNADVQLSFVAQSACTGSLHSLALTSAAYDALSREEITDQGQGGSLRIQRQQQASKRSSQPACQAPCVRPAAAQAAIVDSRHSLNV